MEILEKLSKIFDLYVFSSASTQKVTQILNRIDPNHDIFMGFLSRENCFFNEKGILFKDLRIIKNKDLNEIILIDHTTISIVSQINNCIPLLFWDGSPDDCELKHLMKYLKKISFSFDIREENKKWFKLSDLITEGL